MTQEVHLQKLFYEDEDTGETYEIYVQSKEADAIDVDRLDEDLEYEGRPSRGEEDSAALEARDRTVRAIRTMRGCAGYAVKAFRGLAGANVEEISLEFGLKFAGKAGVPLVTESSAEANMKIQVKLKFPNSPT